MKITIPAGYRSQSEDCLPEIDWLQFQRLSNYTPTQRLEIAIASIRKARRFSLSCLQQNFPQLKNQELASFVAQTWLQEYYPANYVPQSSPMSWIQDSITLAATLHQILTKLNLPYYVTGGVAAIAYGEPRTTQDLDVVVYVDSSGLSRLIMALEADGFYVAGRDNVVIGRISILQITQIATICRGDLILTNDDPYEQLKLSRCQVYSLPDNTEINLASAEDLILSKLAWSRKSKSDKQWRDILGILKTQRAKLDFSYLDYWSQRLNVSDPLIKAKRESGI
ncbi:MAG TPA: hypothetical protein ACFCUY_07425 [Xenococcaceae cyanobacterium]|jgi:hypothetical protein